MSVERKPRVESYRDLVVWQRAMDFAADVYKLAGRLPASELYGLASQLKRAATSVAANIAEGYGRATGPDYANFLSMARGSLLEAETLLLLGGRLGYLAEQDVGSLLADSTEIGKMILSLRRRIVSSPIEAPRSKRDS